MTRETPEWIGKTPDTPIPPRVKLRLGYVSPVFGPKGEIVGMTIDSTAFDAMDQQAFNLFYEAFAGLVAKEMGINIGDVE